MLLKQKWFASLILLVYALILPAPYLYGQEAGGTPYNVIIIGVDAFRADHTSFSGYYRETTPFLDILAKKGIVFEKAISQASWTLPSFSSLFTSKYVESHEAFHMNRSLKEEELTLAEILKQNGYQTAAFVGGVMLEPQYGFTQGFDYYSAGGSRFFSDVTPLALEWIKKHKKDPFFLFLHGNDLHPPFYHVNLPESTRHKFDAEYKGAVDKMLMDYYFVRVFNRYPWNEGWGPAPTEEYLAKVESVRNNPREMEHIIAHYDSQIAFADETIRQFWKALRELGLHEKTILLITGDHGLELGEKGLLAVGYHDSLWETVIHVPLIIWHPDLQPKKISTVVELVDAAPTLLDMLGIPIPDSFEGDNLIPLIKGSVADSPDHYAFSASSIVGPENKIRLHSIQNSQWKLIYHTAENKFKLYNLKEDPHEDNDVNGENSKIVLQLSQKLFQHLRKSKPESRS